MKTVYTSPLTGDSYMVGTQWESYGYTTSLEQAVRYMNCIREFPELLKEAAWEKEQVELRKCAQWLQNFAAEFLSETAKPTSEYLFNLLAKECGLNPDIRNEFFQISPQWLVEEDWKDFPPDYDWMDDNYHMDGDYE